MRKIIIALMLLLAAAGAPGSASAQSGCSSIRTGAVLTAAQWQSCFSLKQDYLGSLTAIPLNTGNIFYGVSNVAVATLPTAVFDSTFCSTRGALLSRQTASWACLGVGTAGQALVSAGAGADPAFGTLGVAGGGTGAATLTVHGVLIGQGTSAITSLPCAVGQSVQWPTGTGADPACTSTPTFGANGGTGGQITFSGSTSGSVALRVAAAAGTATVFQMPATNGTSGQFLTTNGSGVTSWASPSATSPTTQRLTSGAGATFTPTAGAVRWRVRMAGPGGGGGAIITNNGSNGSAATSFQVNSTGTAWTAAAGSGGGLGGGQPGSGGSGGTDGSTGTLIIRYAGGGGNTGVVNGTAGISIGGGAGGSNPFGGGGPSLRLQTGGAAIANTGGGGGGGGGNDATASGSAGGAGEYVEFWVTGMTTATYTIGTGGAGGAAGTRAGGSGAAGIVIVEEFYNYRRATCLESEMTKADNDNYDMDLCKAA